MNPTGSNQRPTTDAQHRAKGLLLASMGIITISPETLLIRLIDANHWTIVLWRGFLTAACLIMIASFGDGKGIWRRFVGAGPWWILIVLLFGMSQILFVVAVTHTTAANTLVILSAAPLSAAVMTRIFLKELVPPSTWVAVGVVAAAVVLIFRGSMGGGTLLGDLAAFLATVGFSGILTVLRRAREINMIPALAVGALLAGVLSFPFADPLAVSTSDIGLLILVGLVLVPVAIVLITSAPKFISAAEVGLVLPLEAVLGTLWVWFALGEVPSLATAVAGAVILGTLIIHSAVRVESVARAAARMSIGSDG